MSAVLRYPRNAYLAVLAAADLGYNFFASLVPEINDGISVRGVLQYKSHEFSSGKLRYSAKYRQIILGCI